MSNFKIGQILYVLREKSIIPVQVAEIITRQKISGRETLFLVNLPKTEDGSEPVNLLKVKGQDGEVYENLEELKKKMLDNATNAINGLIKKTKEIVAQRFKVETKDNIIDEFGDGLSFAPTAEEQRENLKKKMARNGEEDRQKIVLDDGTVANISFGEPRS